MPRRHTNANHAGISRSRKYQAPKFSRSNYRERLIKRGINPDEEKKPVMASLADLRKRQLCKVCWGNKLVCGHD